jgi:endonuclease-3
MAREVFRRLSLEFPGTAQELCELDHNGPFQLLVATILSAQTTDARVNTVTPEVFRRWPDPVSLAGAPVGQLEEVLHPTGFFRQKAKSLLGMAALLIEHHGAEVPSRMEDLVRLPGVGRKTANVIRSVGFGLPGLPVDTHVLRLTRRFGLTDETDPVKVESAVGALLAGRDHGLFSERVILHGRRVCFARKPACGECVLADICPSAFRA